MAQNDIGIDLGTTTIIIAQEGQGVVLNQPSVVAVDTRKNCVLEAGDKALAMVGRRDVVNRMMSNVRQNLRYSGLAALLAEALPPENLPVI